MKTEKNIVENSKKEDKLIQEAEVYIRSVKWKKDESPEIEAKDLNEIDKTKKSDI